MNSTNYLTFLAVIIAVTVFTYTSSSPVPEPMAENPPVYTEYNKLNCTTHSGYVAKTGHKYVNSKGDSCTCGPQHTVGFAVCTKATTTAAPTTTTTMASTTTTTTTK